MSEPLDPLDPFKNPLNERYRDWRDKETGQYNQKIKRGPDANVHRWYVPGTGREGQTGTERPYRGPSESER